MKHLHQFGSSQASVICFSPNCFYWLYRISKQLSHKMDSAKADYLAALIAGSANLPLGMIYICFLSRTEVPKIRLRCWNMTVDNQFQNLTVAQKNRISIIHTAIWHFHCKQCITLLQHIHSFHYFLNFMPT